MKLSIMLEGQNGLNWQSWKKWVGLVEELGFYGLYRSDHFTNQNPPDKDSLELWVSLTYLASHTSRIKFGPLVTPLSFRHPAHLARMASAVDDLSGGRLKLGLGAGWQVREHENYGFDLLPVKERFDRFEEGLSIIKRFFNTNVPFSYEGHYYKMKDVELLPRPQRRNGPEILIGGNGPKKTLPLVAKYANEWNAVYINRNDYEEINKRLNKLLNDSGKDPNSIRRSIMTNLSYGKTQEDVLKKLNGKDANPLIDRGLIVGTTTDVINQLNALKQTGLDEVMLQWLDLDDTEALEHFAKHVLPEFTN